MRIHVVLIDDDSQFREDLAEWLRGEGFTCTTAPDGERGIQTVEQESPDVVLCDLHLPDLLGVEVIDRLSVSCSETSFLLITAFGTLETAIQAFHRGAADYVLKPFQPDDLAQKIRRCVENRSLRREVRNLRRELSESGSATRIVGRSPAMRDVRKMVERVAPSDCPVLITGESGTGKEVVARAIHELGPRNDKPFVAVNAAALPRELFESELFGHCRGSFTGASSDRPGFFEIAQGGTLFLDEIGDIPRELQPKLLRAIEERQIRRVGSTHARSTDCRVLAATNRDLAAQIEKGQFRTDLYFRLRVVEIKLPPLRERREDIPPLTEHLVRRLNARLKRRVLGVDNQAMRVLMSTPWSGNVRELENALERAMLLSDENHLGLQDLPPEMIGEVHFPAISDDLRSSVSAYEREHIRQVLDATGGNREEAARRLGINPSTLYRRLKETGT